MVQKCLHSTLKEARVETIRAVRSFSFSNDSGRCLYALFGEDNEGAQVYCDGVLPQLVDELRGPEWAASIQLDEFSDEIVFTRISSIRCGLRM